MKKIKYYFKAKLVCESPLHIGCGLDDNSNNDILRDADGNPFIPGTTLAGKIKWYLKACGEKVDEIFGRPESDKNDGDLQSDIIFYDAEPENGTAEITVSIRDNVRIDNEGVAEDGAKFDYEIIEPGASFEFRVELLTESREKAEQLFSCIVEGFNNGDIRLGAKTARGLGEISIKDPKYYYVDLMENIVDYISFSWEKVVKGFEVVPQNNKLYEKLEIDFEVDAFLFIRNYSCISHDINNENKLIDSEQLTYRNGKAVIPGTSWAGAFRHHFGRILNKINQPTENDETNIERPTEPYFVKEVFGDVSEDEKSKNASKIIFSETVVSCQNMHNRTRNAIDRFTGGAGDGVLFTTRPSFGGKVRLEIKIPKDIENKAKIMNLIDICIQDFNEGFLNIGGEGSTGGGLIRMKKVEDWI